MCTLGPLPQNATMKHGKRSLGAEDIWNVEAPHVPKSAGTTAEERESFGKLLDSGFKDPGRQKIL